MFNNFLKTALRQLTKNKLYSLLNITGMALGVTCMLLALLYWLHERNFDSFHENGDHLYRISTTLIEQEGASQITSGGTGQVQGPAFLANIPEVEDYVRVWGGHITSEVRHEAEVCKLNMLYADANFFELFSYPLIEGDAESALKEINSIVLSEQAALKFFNTTDAVGKLLHLDADPSAKRLGNRPMMVTAVAKNPPSNSSIQFEMIVPFSFLQLSFDDKNWLNAYLGTFVRINENTNLKALPNKFQQIYAQQSIEQIKSAGFDPKISYGLQPMSDLHFNSMLDNGAGGEMGTVGESKPLYSNLFLGIAFFIFLLASINFVNINIAGSLKRAKEISIRKVIGSTHRSIFAQFLGEAALLSGIALVVALFLVEAVLPLFNELAGQQLELHQVLNWKLGAGMVLVFLATVLFSGLYPAVVLSGFQPVKVLYNRSRSAGRFKLGKGLVVLQFALAFMLAVGSVAFYAQLDFIFKKDLGYNPSFIVRSNIDGNRDYEAIKQVLKTKVAQNDSFEGISFGGEFGFETRRTKIGAQNINAVYQSIDENYLSIMDIPLRAGQNFTSKNSREVLVNQAFVEAAGLNEPIGSLVNLDPNLSDTEEPFQIVGVVEDYHFESLHKPIQPLALYQLPRHSGSIWLKIQQEKSQEGLTAFSDIYQEAIPNSAYTFNFLSDLIAKEYAQENRWQSIIGIASILALLVCGLGLFGMAHLNTAHRVKEIGVRRVLGATTLSLVGTLSKDFLLLVILSLLIASPIAYYFMEQWLQNFSFRIDIEWWLFALAGLATIGVAFLTVGFQGFRAALADPVESLRSE